MKNSSCSDTSEEEDASDESLYFRNRPPELHKRKSYKIPESVNISNSRIKADYSSHSPLRQNDSNITNYDSTPEKSPNLKKRHASPKHGTPIPSPKLNKSKQNSNTKSSCWMYSLLGVLILLIVCGACLNIGNIGAADAKCKVPIDRCTNEIKIALKIAIKETITFNRPSSLLLIYEEDKELLKNKILEQIMQYSACKLNRGTEYAEITEHMYATPEVISDRGKIIKKYENLLKQHGVMLVHNLEKVTGNAAMAFHYFSDQYSPIVDRALIIYTMKYQKDNEQMPDLVMVEQILTEKWKDELKLDDIPPLIARLTNEVLRI